MGREKSLEARELLQEARDSWKTWIKARDYPVGELGRVVIMDAEVVSTPKGRRLDIQLTRKHWLTCSRRILRELGEILSGPDPVHDWPGRVPGFLLGVEEWRDRHRFTFHPCKNTDSLLSTLTLTPTGDSGLWTLDTDTDTDTALN